MGVPEPMLRVTPGWVQLERCGLTRNAFAASAVPPFGLPDGVSLHTPPAGALQGLIGTLAQPLMAVQPTHGNRLHCHNVHIY